MAVTLAQRRALRESCGMPPAADPSFAPDGRYFVVRGRLWRCSDPGLPPDRRAELVNDLMSARRAVRAALKGDGDLPAARARGEKAKRGLGERGPVWWTDGAPDLNRHMAKNTPYAAWCAALQASPPACL